MKKRHTRATLALLLAGAVSVAVWLGWRDSTQPVLHIVRVEVPGLAREYHILQVADLHGSTFGPTQADIAALVSGRRFDAVVMTGDLVLDRGDTKEPAVELAQVLARTSDVLVSTAGNHDDRTVGPALAGAGVHDLDAAGPVRAGGLLLESADGPASTAGDVALRVIAVHAPPSPAELARTTADPSAPTLVLSGHTHGGQIRLPFIGGLISPPTAQTRGKFVLLPELRGVRLQGEYRDGRTESYISSGLGSQGGLGLPGWLRFRWGDRAELTEIVAHGPSPAATR